MEVAERKFHTRGASLLMAQADAVVIEGELLKCKGDGLYIRYAPLPQRELLHYQEAVSAIVAGGSAHEADQERGRDSRLRAARSVRWGVRPPSLSTVAIVLVSFAFGYWMAALFARAVR